MNSWKSEYSGENSKNLRTLRRTLYFRGEWLGRVNNGQSDKYQEWKEVKHNESQRDDITGISQFLEVHITLFCFYKTPTLVPVFNNLETSEDNLRSYQKK